MKISVIWFTYKDDQYLLSESVKSVHRTFNHLGQDLTLNVIDDGMNPIDTNIQQALKNLYNIKYKKTFYPRNGHLLGPENLQGQVKEMLEASKSADILVKIDCDTLLLKSDWIEEFYKTDKSILMVGSYKTNLDYPMGNCYALKANILKKLYTDVVTYKAWDSCFEDYEVGVRLHRFAKSPEYALRYRSGPVDGFWLCDPPQVTPEAEQARVVSVGYGNGGVLLKDKDEYKRAQLGIMMTININIDKALNPS